MRTTTALTILLTLGGFATSASAQLRGSDTLEGITKALLTNAACNGSPAITYGGGGSTVGENAMRDNLQNISPMSRALNNNTAVCVTAGGNATAEGMLFGLDGMVIVADSEQTERCGSAGKVHAARGNLLVNSAATPGTDTTPGAVPAPVYSDMGSDWQVKLRQLYWGLPGTSGTTGADCNNATRVALANNYKGLFPNSCSAAGGQANTCSGIHRVFRRGDLSGTTDLFRTLLGAGSVPFCNSPAGAVSVPPGTPAFPTSLPSDQQDRDPIRRACTESEQVCGPDGTLGLVLPILVPEGENLDQIYPIATCPNGVFRRLPAPFEDSACCARNGNGSCRVKSAVLKCFQPVIAAGNAPCLNGWQTGGCGAFENQVALGGFPDQSRYYNLSVRTGGTGNFYSYANGGEVTAAYYRIHSTAGGHCTQSSNAARCREVDSTRQIGCLVQKPNSGCNIGFAGGEAVQLTRAEPLALNGIDWTDANIQNLVSGAGPVYGLARKLYLNTIDGFQTLSGAERNLAACFATPSTINPVLDQFGYTRLPSQDPICEEACPNGPAGVHCGGNPAPFN